MGVISSLDLIVVLQRDEQSVYELKGFLNNCCLYLHELSSAT